MNLFIRMITAQALPMSVMKIALCLCFAPPEIYDEEEYCDEIYEDNFEK